MTPPLHSLSDSEPVFPCELYYPGDKNTEAFWSPTLHRETWLKGMPGFTHWRPKPTPPKATPERPITSLNADEAEKMVDAFHGASPSSEDTLRRTIDSAVYAKPYQQSDAYLRTLAEDLYGAIRPLLQKQADDYDRGTLFMVKHTEEYIKLQQEHVTLETLCAKWKDCAEYGWTIIASASGGNWQNESADWQQAAARFRDQNYYPCLRLTPATLQDALAKAQAEVERLNEQSASDKTYWDKTNQHLIDDNVAKDRRIAELEQSFQAQRDNYIRLYQAVMGDGTVTAEFADPAEYARALHVKLTKAETAAREGAGERERLLVNTLGEARKHFKFEQTALYLIRSRQNGRVSKEDLEKGEAHCQAAMDSIDAALSAQPPAKSEGET